MAESSIIFTAAGSGGHIFAAIATLKAFQAHYPTLSKNLVFVGSTLTMEGEKKQLPMEERICTRLGVPFRKIRMGKLQRTFSLNSIRLFLKIIAGFWDAWLLINELKPKVIIAFGGYVSLPMVIVGKLRGAKIILHEQTSNVGLTNRLLQPFADVIAVTYEVSKQFLKKPAIVVGSPTMEHIYTIEDYDHLIAYIKKEHSRLLEEPEYLEKLKWVYDQRNKRPILLMSGGSQGSHPLNERIKAILPELLKTMIVIVQVGENEYYNDYKTLSEYVQLLPNDLAQYCILRKFIYEEYGFLIKTATLFLGRSGANTVYQVGMNATSAIFVPIPWVTRNEQYTNAMVLKAAGWAEIIEEKNCTPEVLLATIQKEIRKARITEKEEEEYGKVPVFPVDADVRLAREISKLAV